VLAIDVVGLEHLRPLLGGRDGVMLPPNHCDRADGLVRLDPVPGDAGLQLPGRLRGPAADARVDEGPAAVANPLPAILADLAKLAPRRPQQRRIDPLPETI
jgi:hypothetical protein